VRDSASYLPDQAFSSTCLQQHICFINDQYWVLQVAVRLASFASSCKQVVISLVYHLNIRLECQFVYVNVPQLVCQLSKGLISITVRPFSLNVFTTAATGSLKCSQGAQSMLRMSAGNACRATASAKRSGVSVIQQSI
jgi:hypothetical protein